MRRKPIPNWEDLYEACTTGRIYSIRRGRYLKSRINSEGYTSVVLCRDNYRVQYKVHRLVALCFLPNPDCKPCVNHIDGVKDNNLLTNLEWATKSDNLIHAYQIGAKLPTRGPRAKT